MKKPSNKTIAKVVKTVAALEGGKRLSRGVVGLVPATVQVDPLIIKGGLALGALALALTYSGQYKNEVQSACLGVVAEQGGGAIDMLANQSISRKTNEGVPQKFFNDALGLNGDCGCMTLPPEHQYPSLNGGSTIQTITWDEVYQPENSLEYTDFDELENTSTGNWVG